MSPCIRNNVDRKELRRERELKIRARKKGVCKIQWLPRKKGVWGLVVWKVHPSLLQVSQLSELKPLALLLDQNQQSLNKFGTDT